MASDVPPRVRQALGRQKTSASIARGIARGHSEPAPENPFDGIDEEKSARLARDVVDEMRRQQVTVPDSEPPVLSVHVPIVGRVSARGGVVWLVVLVGGALVALWLLTR